MFTSRGRALARFAVSLAIVALAFVASEGGVQSSSETSLSGYIIAVG